MFNKNKTKRPLILFVILLVLLYLLYTQQANKPTADESITIAVAEQPALALMYVADKKGYFEEEGLKVNFIKYRLGRDALIDTIEGKADLATVYDIPVLNQINNGVDLGILTTLHTSNKNHTIAAFKKNGVETPDDLQGKRVAMTKGVSTEFFLYALLIAEGIDPSDVTIVSIEPELLIPSLENNTVDAAVLFNPYIYSFQTRYPEEELTFLYSTAYSEMSVLTGKKEVIRQKSESITKLLKALHKAEIFIKNNKEESIILAGEWLGKDSVDLVNSTWDIFTFTLSLNNQLLVLMERESNFFVNSGVYDKNTPYLRSYFLPEYLEKVKPEGATLY